MNIEQPNSEQEKLNQIAEELFNMQAKENNGRGVRCVCSVVDYLRLGRKREAMLVASTDHDKIRNYPDIYDFLKERLFDGEELYSWTPETG